MIVKIYKKCIISRRKNSRFFSHLSSSRKITYTYYRIFHLFHMAYPIEKKLVIGISSSALFDLSESDKIFREDGEKKYCEYQKKHEKTPLKKGSGFPFIQKLLSINTLLDLSEPPIEVVLLSRNSPETGLRVFNSIEYYNLDISRGAFLSGESPAKYIPSFNIKLFLSENNSDITEANELGYSAGKINKSHFQDNKKDTKLRIAFDFDGVIIDDESEKIFQESGKDVKKFLQYETEHKDIAHNAGPLKDFLEALSEIQKQERIKKEKNPTYQPVIETSIVTARNAPAHKRAITTLQSFGIEVDKMFLMGGIKKELILKELKPHIFFDDQKTHLTNVIPSVHIPFFDPKKRKN